MPDPTPTLAPMAAPGALAAFLKGVERRAAVLAELQAGEPRIGDAALARAMAAFRRQALEHPMAGWPEVFWCELLRQPALRRAAGAPWPARLPAAAAVPGRRALLLLRLVAGLDEAEAAAVLGIAPGSARRALELAVPRAADGGPDAAAWARLRRELQARVQQLPTDRLLRLGRAREEALAGPAEHFFPSRPGLPWRRLAAALAGVAMALAATFWFERRQDRPVETAALGPAGQPASRYSPAAGLVAHPDFALLADPESERIARDMAFLAWSAAQADAEAAARDPLAPPRMPELPLVPYDEVPADAR